MIWYDLWDFFVNSIINLVRFFFNVNISYSLYPDKNVQHDEASDRRQSSFRFTEQQFYSPMSKNEGIKIYTVKLWLRKMESRSYLGIPALFRFTLRHLRQVSASSRMSEFNLHVRLLIQIE